jgi:glycosyltransferase involved in cell wall biosynthesis
VLIGGTGDRWSKDMLESFRRRHANITVSSLDVTTAPAEQTYGAASVLVHPAIEDGYGLVIPQALACGRPVIATRQSGASELIRDGENGFVVESRSVDGLRARLQLLAADRSLRERMGARAPAAVSHLSYNGFRREMLRFYQGALDGRLGA